MFPLGWYNEYSKLVNCVIFYDIFTSYKLLKVVVNTECQMHEFSKNAS